MPLNSDVFAVPPGYNSPQQVSNTLSVHSYIYVYTSVGFGTLNLSSDDLIIHLLGFEVGIFDENH